MQSIDFNKVIHPILNQITICKENISHYVRLLHTWELRVTKLEIKRQNSQSTCQEWLQPYTDYYLAIRRARNSE